MKALRIVEIVTPGSPQECVPLASHAEHHLPHQVATSGLAVALNLQSESRLVSQDVGSCGHAISHTCACMRVCVRVRPCACVCVCVCARATHYKEVAMH